jgi:hypothetical protein
MPVRLACCAQSWMDGVRPAGQMLLSRSVSLLWRDAFSAWPGVSARGAELWAAIISSPAVKIVHHSCDHSE